MTYIRDLTKYTYHSMEGDDGILAVGWLNFHEPFEQDKTPPGLVDKLKELPVTRLCRGSHFCPWCILRHTSGPEESPYGNPNIARGNGEIWVEGEDKIYAAPFMIIHYIEEHNYLPPQEFIDAVMKE